MYTLVTDPRWIAVLALDPTLEPAVPHDPLDGAVLRTSLEPLEAD